MYIYIYIYLLMIYIIGHVLAHDLYHFDNIAWHIFIENKLKIQSVWDVRRKFLAKFNKGPCYNKKHKN